MTAPVDDLRERLRALGYLETGVDRFVLGPVRDTRGLGTIALRSSLRIGMLGAVLLGPAAAVGVALRLPALVTGVQDAIVLALYLGALFGAATATVGFVAAVLAGVLVRSARPGPAFAHRARALTAGAGFLAAVVSLVYLTLWWQSADPAAGWNAPAWTGFALALAVIISFLLGHTVRVAALAVVARSAGTSELAPGPPHRTWRTTTAIGAAAFLGAASLLFSTSNPEDADAGRSSPDFAVVPTGLRVTLIAIDGFDASLYARLRREGRTSALQRLLDGSRASIAVTSVEDPVNVWTTVATGQPAGVHGLDALEARRVAGVQGRVATGGSPLARTIAAATDLLRLSRPVVLTGAERRAKTFWEVAAEQGFRVAVINWWATWPALGSNATIITDRAAVRLDRGGALAAEIAPARLYEELKSQWPDLRAKAQARATRNFPGDDRSSDTLRRSAELDILQVQVASLPVIGRPDLLVVYLPGLDIARHAMLGEDLRAPAPSDLAARLEALGKYYGFLDELVSPLLEPDETSALTAVVTHPGRVAGPAEAWFALGGAVTREGLALEAELIDIAPTVAYTLGLPVSLELPGRPLVEMLSGSFTARHPTREVATYGVRRPPPATGDPAVDREVLERLRSLGYVR